MSLGWLFIASYAVALGGMLGKRGSARAGAVAAAAALAFCLAGETWVHGVLLLLFAVGGMALFVATSWAAAATAAKVMSPARRQESRAAPSTPASISAPRPPARPIGDTVRVLWRTHVTPVLGHRSHG